MAIGICIIGRYVCVDTQVDTVDGGDSVLLPRAPEVDVTHRAGLSAQPVVGDDFMLEVHGIGVVVLGSVGVERLKFLLLTIVSISASMYYILCCLLSTVP